MQFIGLDFGTTNSLAGVVDAFGKLKLVPLAGEKFEMPSAIFLKVNHEPPLVISAASFEIRFKNARDKEQLRIIQERDAVDRQLKEFIKVKRPRAIKPKGFYYNSVNFNKAWDRYLRDLENLPSALKYFYDNEVILEEQRLIGQINAPCSDEELRLQVRGILEQELVEAELEMLSNQTFFTALNSDNVIPFFGDQAISEYIAAPLSGFYMGSPKAFLAVHLNDSQRELFVRVITLILVEIKKRSEEHLGYLCDGVIFGRPVNYMGSKQGGGNQQALDIMRKAAVSAGFNQVRFIVEPMAASLVISKAMFDSDVPALVVDVGGGTTDVVVLGVDSSAEVKLTVISTSGERVGGCDFDQAIAIRKIGPLIGTQAKYRNGRDVPNGVVMDALSTRDIHGQAKFRSSGDKIQELIAEVIDPSVFHRLYRVLKQQLQHRLLMNSEEVKIGSGLTPVRSIELVLQHESFTLSIEADELNIICESELKSIQRLILEALKNREETGGTVRVFLTGGMSLCPGVVDSIRELFPDGINIRRISSLQAVAAGLAVAARHLSLTENIFLENYNVRGIPVSR